ncbi:MAG: vitamin B12-dependent ribonucleotide reductase [Clostridiales bacterium]|jgi:ribonucleoside-diphosphate reductase alpha chain|nr:vitamin B12-dependent ribonucleotide reductase [Clostridiales bacterium]
MELDGKIYRLYTTGLINSDKSVYELFQWKKVDVKLTNYSSGAVLTDMRDLEFPEDYSQSACDIIASKFFRKKGVPNDRGYEYSMKQLVHRMVSFWTDALYDEVIVSREQKHVLYDELAYMMLAQIWAPNSPQFFNTGLNLAYGIKGNPQGHFYYDEDNEAVAGSSDAYTRTQGSACFILRVEDSLIGKKSLTDQLTTETLLFKYGSGVGANWSAIRAKNETLSGGGKSSGLLSFLKVSDRNAGAIKSGGTTRRAAKMNILNLDHPEIMDFISWKSHEEDKVAALGKMGYSIDIDGEAYETVSGQNANNSIRVPDSFMKLLDQPEAAWKTVGRVDKNAEKTIHVSEIWDKTAYAAWRCGDPGVQFDDTINAWHTCPYGEDGELSAGNRINASNPCSEYMFLDDTACNLASVNILKFYDMDMDTFDIDAYLHAVCLIQMALEATIHWGQFPTEDIARRSYLFRATGLGLTNLGALFMCMGLPYDSDGARNIGAALCSLMTGYSYYTSALMAEKVGPFPCYDINRDAMKRVIRNHARAASRKVYDTDFEDLPYIPACIDHSLIESLGNITEILRGVWSDAINAGEEFGYRNAQVTVLAPTGTIAFAMDCSSTSSEPFFSHVAYKKLVGGNYMVIVNPVISMALRRLGYNESQIASITGYVTRKDDKGVILDGKIEDAPQLKPEHYAVFDTASKCGSGARVIAPEGHVKMMGALTPHITGAISKTVNLPREAVIDDVKRIYKLSWELGVKAIALYRDGCKMSQPLNTRAAGQKEKSLTEYTYQELIDYINAAKPVYEPRRVKPSGIRRARVHEAAINGLKLYITTSFYEDGRLGEIYVSSGRQGSLTKGLLDSMSTTISEMLQYGVPAVDIAKMYRGQKYEPSGIVTGHPYIKFVDSISDLISKIIDIEMGDYRYCQIKPEGYAELTPEARWKEVSRLRYNDGDYIQGELCPNCKSSKMVKNGTCKVCTECGTTTGCS